MTALTVVILTRDEELHIARAIRSVRAIAARVVVVDSGSTDATRAIAAAEGAEVLENPWVNHAVQVTWALGRLAPAGGWILRLDADEIVTPALAAEIARVLPRAGADIDGFHLGRRMNFLGCPVRRGGLFPARVLRLVRAGRAACENRWMDEHLTVPGRTGDLKGEILDDNLNPLDWWTAKHNAYAGREAVDLLNLEFGFMPQDSIADLRGLRQAGVKRWLKERAYARLPGGTRAALYFLYRFVLRLGFLDRREARMFHVLQGFWYRYLVDAKLAELRAHMGRTGAGPEDAIRAVLGIEVEQGQDRA